MSRDMTNQATKMPKVASSDSERAKRIGTSSAQPSRVAENGMSSGRTVAARAMAE